MHMVIETPARPALFPYTTLFRSEGGRVRVKALVTPRVGRGVAFMPFHFGGMFQGENLHDRYPEGSAPYVLGRSEEHTSELQSRPHLVCRLLLERKKALP